MDFKRALVRLLKGTFCKLIGRLLEAKRAYIEIEVVKYYYKIRFKYEFYSSPFGFISFFLSCLSFGLFGVSKLALMTHYVKWRMLKIVE